MDLTLSTDQGELLAAVVDCLDGVLPVSRLHAAEPQRETEEVARLRSLADLGWLRISLSDELGGAGLGLAEEALLFRELGRRLAPASALPAVLGASIAADGGARELADSLAAGRQIIGFAVPEGPAPANQDRPGGTARLFSTGPAELALLVSPNQALIFDVSDARLNARPCLDRTLVMRSIGLDAKVLVRADGPQAWARGLLLLAATLSGQAEAARDMINAYAKVRVTFGRPIGAYQAVRHPIAEMAARCEQARCLMLYAALALDAGRDDALTLASAARAMAQTAATRNDDANIQLHGGIGVTDDLDAHLYLKRATVYSTWFGGPKQQLKALLESPLGEI
jgi:alkylation response protein AidB-like acyl-CoA dehydrogenase